MLTPHPKTCLKQTPLQSEHISWIRCYFSKFKHLRELTHKRVRHSSIYLLIYWSHRTFNMPPPPPPPHLGSPRHLYNTCFKFFGVICQSQWQPVFSLLLTKAKLCPLKMSNMSFGLHFIIILNMKLKQFVQIQSSLPWCQIPYPINRYWCHIPVFLGMEIDQMTGCCLGGGGGGGGLFKAWFDWYISSRHFSKDSQELHFYFTSSTSLKYKMFKKCMYMADSLSSLKLSQGGKNIGQVVVVKHWLLITFFQVRDPCCYINIFLLFRNKTSIKPWFPKWCLFLPYFLWYLLSINLHGSR